MFVRSDELLESWRIWSPLLDTIEQQNAVPAKYMYGSRGPAEGDQLARRAGYVFDSDYSWSKL